MPAMTKSAPLRKAFGNATRGEMAPAAMTLKATHGFSTVSMNAAVSSGLLHHMLSLFLL